MSLGPQFEFHCVCKAGYEGSDKSCGGNADMRGGGGFVSKGGEKDQKVVLLVSLHGSVVSVTAWFPSLRSNVSAMRAMASLVESIMCT